MYLVKPTIYIDMKASQYSAPSFVSAKCSSVVASMGFQFFHLWNVFNCVNLINGHSSRKLLILFYVKNFTYICMKIYLFRFFKNPVACAVLTDILFGCSALVVELPNWINWMYLAAPSAASSGVVRHSFWIRAALALRRWLTPGSLICLCANHCCPAN